MGVTVHYRGRIEELERIEDFEDRVLDLALVLGADARIWRSQSENKPERMVRGLTVLLVPGQDTMSLLISPEGWLIGLTDIEDAEEGRLAEAPWCFVKTQFGPVEGHVALVELLRMIQQEFCPDLVVQDEGGYWTSRDLQALSATFAFLQSAIDGLAEGLCRSGLSREAAEDPEILATRIERIASQVREKLGRPPEDAPVDFDGGDELECWEALYKDNRRRQERIERAVQERIHRGQSPEEALDGAMRDAMRIKADDEPLECSDLASQDMSAVDFEDEMDEEDEPWKASLPAAVVGVDDAPEQEELHPLQDEVCNLMLRLHRLFLDAKRHPGSQIDVLLHGAGEMMGGLAQALGSVRPVEFDGLAIVQLKRALRGAAFARGALMSLRYQKMIADELCDELSRMLDQLETGMLEQLNDLRRDTL